MKKKLNVVMLATQEAENVPFLKNINGRGNNLYPATKGYYYTQQYLKKEQFEAQHLYFTSDEVIKEGDWKYDVVTNLIKKQDGGFSFESDKKIIITTDKLEIPYKFGKWSILPQPTKEFIELYISEYNKGNIMKEVEVDYEEIMGHDGIIAIAFGEQDFKLKTNPDNTVNISLIKDSFSREEVIEKLKNAYHYGRLNPTLDTTKFDKWI